jgi:phosphatidylglycerol:prolipoprotein diacylglycerol transferase
MFPYLHIGPLTLPTPGLIIILGLWLGLSFSERYSSRHGIEANTLYNLVFTALFAGLISARLVYVLRFSASFLADPISILLPNLNTLDPIAGIAGGLLAALIFSNRENLAFWQLTDALTPALAVLAVTIPLANFASGEAYGSVSRLPWAIDLWGAKRHPVQLYELFGSLLILIVIWPSRPWINSLKSGGMFLSFLSLLSLNQLIVEAFRANSPLLLDHYRAIQVISLVTILVSLKLLRSKYPTPILHAPQEN